MSEDDRKRWEERYRKGSHRSGADPFVLQRLSALPEGRMLDVASGTGALALEAAALGHAVTAVDISQTALDELAAKARQRGLHIHTRVADLDAPDAVSGLGPFDLLTITRYKPAPLQWQRLASLLVPGGSLLLCSFSQKDPNMRPAFRLERGELADLLEPPGLFLQEWVEHQHKGDHMAGSVWVRR